MRRLGKSSRAECRVKTTDVWPVWAEKAKANLAFIIPEIPSSTKDSNFGPVAKREPPISTRFSSRSRTEEYRGPGMRRRSIMLPLTPFCSSLSSISSYHTDFKRVLVGDHDLRI